MGSEPQAQDHDEDRHAEAGQAHASTAGATEVDGLKNKKPEELTPEELRLMADTMPGEGPGN